MTARLRAVRRRRWPASKRDLSFAIHNAQQNSHPRRLQRHPHRPDAFLRLPNSVICILIGYILGKSFIGRSVDGCIYLNIVETLAAVAAGRCFYMHHRWAWHLRNQMHHDYVEICFFFIFVSRPCLCLLLFYLYDLSASLSKVLRGVFRGGRNGAPPPKLSKGIMHARENH